MKRLVRCLRCKTTEKITSYKPRKKGHIKHMYCFRCKDTTAHREITSADPKLTASEKLLREMRPYIKKIADATQYMLKGEICEQ